MTTAIDPVIIDFAARGLTDVSRAFETVEARLQRFERNAVRNTQTGTRERERAHAQLVKQIERGEKQAAREAEKAEKGKTREAQNETKRREALHRRSSEMAGRYASQAARLEIREAQKAAREIERLEEWKMRVRIRSSEMAGRAAAREAQEEIAAANRAARSRGHAGRRIGGVITGSVGGMVSTGASLAGMAMGVGGGFMLADVARREMNAGKTAALLVNAVTAQGQAPEGANVNAIMGQASGVSKALGMDKEQLLQGTLSYARTAKGGDFKGAMANMAFFGKMSQVTGTDINEIASSAGMLQSQNQKLQAPEMQQLLLDMYAQSKAGSLSMPELAKMAGTIGSVRGSFAGDQTANQRTLMAMAQLVTPETNPEDAGTMVKDLALEAGAHRNGTKGSKGLQQMGVKFNKQGQMESVQQMVDALLTYSKGDVTSKAFTENLGIRGGTLFRHLTPIYNDAGGGQKGLDAVHKELASVTGATMSGKDLDTQHDVIMNTPGQRLATAVNKIEETLGQKLEPRLSHFAEDTLPKMIPMIEKVIDKGTEFADWFADNPIKGVGAIVLAKVGADLANAGIGAGVKAILEKLLASGGGGGVPVPGGGGGGGAGELFGKASLVGLAGYAGGALAQYEIDKAVGGKEAQQRALAMGTTQDVQSAYGVLREVRAGAVTPEGVAAVQRMAMELSATAESYRQQIGTNDMGLAQTAVMQLADPKGAKQYAEDNYRNQLEQYKQAKEAADLWTKAAKEASSALKGLAETAGGVPPVKSNAPATAIAATAPPR